MPFPLAHPAAVLPLRRYCGRWLIFPALVVGAVVPDASYLLGPAHLDVFSHTFAGSLVFGVPAGLVMLGLFYGLRSRVVERLPQRYRDLFRPLCNQPGPAAGVLVLSLLLGIWSHVFWDGFTHKEGWFVRVVPWLQSPLLPLGHRHVRVCHVLWYLSSFIGIACLYWVYQSWRQTPAGGSRPVSPGLKLRDACLMALLFFPIEALHHLLNNTLEAAVVGVLTLAMILAALWTLDRGTTNRPNGF